MQQSRNESSVLTSLCSGYFQEPPKFAVPFCFFPFPRYPGSASETNSDDIAEWAQPWSLVAKCLTTVVFCANTTI